MTEEVRRVVSEDAVATLGLRPQRIEELKDLRTLGAIGCFLSHLAVWQVSGKIKIKMQEREGQKGESPEGDVTCVEVLHCGPRVACLLQ